MIVYHSAPTIERTSTPSGDEVCHLVCACQMEAAPRIAMCGWDCSELAEGEPRFPCVICREVYAEACSFCGEAL